MLKKKKKKKKYINKLKIKIYEIINYVNYFKYFIFVNIFDMNNFSCIKYIYLN